MFGRARLVGIAAALFSVSFCGAAVVTSASPAAAFSVFHEEWELSNNGTTPCGELSYKDGAWAPCYIGFSYDSSITSRVWWPYVRAGAFDWCYHADPYHGNQNDFCWEDVTGTTSPAFAQVNAADLGYNANGSTVLGEETNYSDSLYYPETGQYTLTNAYVTINDNTHVPWYKNAGSSYTVPTSDWDLQSTVTHEMGHALGLNHPTKNDTGPSSPVMACILYNGVANHTNADDQNGEHWIYGGENSHWGSPQPSPC